MGPGQFSTRGSALTNCWLPKKDQGDSLCCKSPENQEGIKGEWHVMIIPVPGPEKAKEDEDNRKEVAEEELEKDVQAVHCIPKDKNMLDRF